MLAFWVSASSRLSFILDNDSAETLIVPSSSGLGFGGGTISTGVSTSSSTAGRGVMATGFSSLGSLITVVSTAAGEGSFTASGLRSLK